MVSQLPPGNPPAILFADARLIVIDKPAGLPVHSGPSGSACVEDLFPHLSRRKTGPWLAHRLDADTSGCLAIALTKTALIAAQKAFAAGRVHKTYWALTAGTPATAHGEVDAPLIKRSTKAGWRMHADPAGDPALTAWRVLASQGGISLLELHPRTGRTHQIRVHCALLGCPILGDAIYGTPGGTLALLARALHLPLDPPISAEAPVPPHMQVAYASLTGNASSPFPPPA